MYQQAIEHLRQSDPKLARVIDRVGDCGLTRREGGSHFDALVRAIVYQQLSGKAAATIHGRFEGLYGDRPPTPEEVLATDDERLRGVGLSWQKISYIKDLASKVASGELDTESLDAMPDDEIISSLVRVKGIGRWSAQMFLMFRLGRPNVLPDLDLGVQKGIQHAYRLPKLPTPKDVLRIGEAWAPFASVASWYMWRLLELPDVIRREAEARSASRTARAAEVTTATPRKKSVRNAAKRAFSARKSAVRKVLTPAVPTTRGKGKTAVKKPRNAGSSNVGKRSAIGTRAKRASAPATRNRQAPRKPTKSARKR
jgi:DNA-3-methyladenine glycosylase II